MMNYRAVLLIFLCAISFSSIDAQRYNIGIRAGLNYSKILGPKEEGLSVDRGFNNGIHFGLTYAYKFTDIFGIKTELGYSSVGSRETIEGDGYYVFGLGQTGVPFSKEGAVKRFIETTNAYINLPIHAYIKPFEKLEIFGGPYVGFLINPSAGGTLNFDDLSEETKFGFIQSLDYNYYSDNALQGKNRQAIQVIIDEVTYQMPQAAGAYYQFQEKDGSLYRWLDVGLSLGAQYYINRSFFASVRADYGLVDITRRAMDVSYRELNENSFILRDDFDQNFSLQFSLGFKF